MTLPAELAVAVWLEVGQKSKLADGDGRERKIELTPVGVEKQEKSHLRGKRSIAENYYIKGIE